MKTRSFLIQLLAPVLLLGTGGVTFAVLSAENSRRKEKEKKIRVLEDIRQSRRETAFKGVCTVESFLRETHYVTRMEISRTGEDRKVRLIGSHGGKKTRHGSKMRFFGGIPGLFQPGKFRRAQLQDPARIAHNYHITMKDGISMAGRPGKLVRILPKWNDRPSYEMVADQETSFPLRFSVFGKAGNIAYEKKFESIHFLPGMFHGRLHGKRNKGPTWVNISQEEIDFDGKTKFNFQVWVPGHLPTGFSRTDAMLVKIQTTPPKMLPEFQMNLEVIHLAYSDGIALFTMVQFSRENPVWKMMKTFFPETESGEGVSTRKISLGIGTAFIMELNNTVVILSGNIWAETLQKTAESLKPYIGDES